jgi:hypothetical protein
MSAEKRQAERTITRVQSTSITAGIQKHTNMQIYSGEGVEETGTRQSGTKDCDVCMRTPCIRQRDDANPIDSGPCASQDTT